MYEVLTLTESQYRQFDQELRSRADTIPADVLRKNYVMINEQLPVAVAITQELYRLLFEQLPFLREHDSLITPRPDSIREGTNWIFLYGDEGRFNEDFSQ